MTLTQISLHEEIGQRRELAVKRIIWNMPVLGLSAAGLAGLLPGPWWIWGPVTAFQALCVAANLHEVWNMRQALRIYNSSPVVAYLAEVRHAFPGATAPAGK